MGKSKETFNKKEKEKKRLKKRKEKEEKKAERRANSPGGGLENMLAYVDEFGNISDTPPSPDQKVEVDVESIELGIPKKTAEDKERVYEGKVDYYSIEKGYGFIKDRVSGEKYFFHKSSMQGDILVGDKVAFQIEKSPKGWAAVQLKRI